METLESEIAQLDDTEGTVREIGQGQFDAVDELGHLARALATERERGLRLLAEFDNYRRRTRLELAGAREAGRRDVLVVLLELMDDFDRALAHLGDASEPVADGLRLTHRRLDEVLSSFGINAFESEGHPFDPNVHEALAAVDCDPVETDTVHAEIRRGYVLNGELLRPARVTVAKSAE